MALITSAVSWNDEEQCRDMFESFIEGMSQRPSPQYCRGVSHLNNVLKLTSPIALQVLEKKKKKRKGHVGKPCECMELEV
ncbi:Non-specific lipid-transfer-like protein [Hirschfeldia incana]|nr:Non-specific lipid-transfer-like protein [Hirschfeldia incana]